MPARRFFTTLLFLITALTLGSATALAADSDASDPATMKQVLSELRELRADRKHDRQLIQTLQIEVRQLQAKDAKVQTTTQQLENTDKKLQATTLELEQTNAQVKTLTAYVNSLWRRYCISNADYYRFRFPPQIFGLQSISLPHETIPRDGSRQFGI